MGEIERDYVLLVCNKCQRSDTLWPYRCSVMIEAKYVYSSDTNAHIEDAVDSMMFLDYCPIIGGKVAKWMIEESNLALPSERVR